MFFSYKPFNIFYKTLKFYIKILNYRDLKRIDFTEYTFDISLKSMDYVMRSVIVIFS